MQRYVSCRDISEVVLTGFVRCGETVRSLDRDLGMADCRSRHGVLHASRDVAAPRGLRMERRGYEQNRKCGRKEQTASVAGESGKWRPVATSLGVRFVWFH